MQQIKFYDYNGNLVNKPTTDVCAKAIFHENTGRTVFYVKTKNGNLYNPEDDLDKRKISTNRFRFEKIDEEGFKLYLKYLGYESSNMHQSKAVRRHTLLIQAQRRL